MFLFRHAEDPGNVQEDPFTDVLTITSADKITMENEAMYLRDMLKRQTETCDELRFEINRLKSEIKVNEDKFNFTLRKIESFLTKFNNTEKVPVPSRNIPAACIQTTSNISRVKIIEAEVSTENTNTAIITEPDKKEMANLK
ncbi:hypothetical protein Phum_PHUM404980 [Pediculus humanus corporis]|uniref:Uncharacterized protein n=1 Tax=Pediculus humanus subsp. corporis TaxID=121224 RepID=E0VRU9_PEDHC|nr:uncharacterized protein Phum_PHUM404980 [Pediculus humanus corporis]EEB16105.1 hypothetical protein Phum_PHUM404980 [Pediculus humanus corporis]